MRFVDKISNFKFTKTILLVVILLFFSVVGSTYAYLFISDNGNNSITGDMGKVDLELDVTRVLPENTTVNSLLIFRFNELADNLNKGCIDKDGEYSLCQLYKINLKNKNGGVNTKVKGSLAFSNPTMPNLSWILLGNTYSSSKNYTSSMLGSSFNNASSTYDSFVDDYLLRQGDEISFYILVWVNEIDRIQYDRGSYSGVVRFEDHKGNGVTAEFGDTGSNKENIFTKSVMKLSAISDEGIDFSKTSEQTGTNGIYMVESTAEDKYPVYYYRGNVDNNLIFAGYCWKVVRTTETGGLKILYNGVPTDGKCMGTDTSLGNVPFNSSWNLLKYAGYMYSDGYQYNNKNIRDINEVYKYGNSVKYENGMYTLDESKSIVSSSSWASIYNTGLNNTHYTCFSTGITCSEVHYIYYTSNTSAYYITLSNGKKVEDALADMLGSDEPKFVDPNNNSSIVKGNETTVGTLDHWYYTNIKQKGYDEYIEDTVWCNDRTLYQYGGWNPNGGGNRTPAYFSIYDRLDNKYSPLIQCPRKIDSFTVDSKNGNGALEYPVGLLTADEVMLAGGVHFVANSTYYLNSGYNYWLGTAAGFGMDVAVVSYISNNGELSDYFVNSNYGARPAISLKAGFSMTGDGDGTANNPYLVE